MPFLPIGKSAIESPTRFDLAKIEAIMLFPEDEAERALVERAAAARVAVETAEKEQIHAAKGDAIAQLLRYVHEAPRLSEIVAGEKFFRRHLFGRVAGIILTETLARRELHPNAPNMGHVKKRLGAGLKNLKVSKATIDDTIWPRFACVAHLWAAYLALMETTGSDVFPCQVRHFPGFLAVAEANRIEGQNYRIKQASRPVLDAEKTWRVPDGVILPKIPSKFEPVNRSKPIPNDI